MQSIPEDASDLIFGMLRAFIRDMDAGKSLSEAGWVPLGNDDIKRLRKIDFCEIDYENMNGRINYKRQLPAELLLTEEGHVFCEYLRAVKIVQEVEALKDNDNEYLKAVAAGLNEMLKNARYSFWEKREGLIPDKLRNAILSPQWNIFARKIAYLLTSNLLESIWGISNLIELHEDLGKEEIVDFDANMISVIEEIKGNPQWVKIVDFFQSNKDLLEALSLAWYVNQRAVKEEVEYLGSELLIFEAAIRIVADKNDEDVTTLYEKLTNLDEELDKLVYEENRLDEEKWGVNWNSVFRFPY